MCNNRVVGIAAKVTGYVPVLTMCSGKLLATVLSEPDAPPAPPVPVRKPQKTNKRTVVLDARS